MKVIKQPIIRIYIDKAFLPEDATPIPMVLGFWNLSYQNNGDPRFVDFQDLKENCKKYFESTDIETCDVAVYPCYWQQGSENRLAHALARKAKQHGKRMLLFNGGDYEGPIEIENTIVLRTSLKKSRRTPLEYVIPSWNHDYLSQNKRTLITRSWNPIPSVGYCGYTAKSKHFLSKYIHKSGATPKYDKVLRKIGIPLIKSPGVRLRTQAVKLLDESPKVNSNFILRTNGFDGVRNIELARRKTKEFYSNVLNSDYTICVRGAGNFSIRFYETLLCGRIPLFINTDCALPFENKINWRAHCLYLDENSIEKIVDILMEGHLEKRNDFVAIQKKNRELWNEWLSPCGFHQKLHHYLVPD